MKKGIGEALSTFATSMHVSFSSSVALAPSLLTQRVSFRDSTAPQMFWTAFLMSEAPVTSFTIAPPTRICPSGDCERNKSSTGLPGSSGIVVGRKPETGAMRNLITRGSNDWWR
uniref:Uncharacterized protein n=1 Tax=Lotharella globosa TaxID=91324 RepID=A0A7S3YPE7_9EUKA